MSAEGVPVLLDRADVLKALRDTLSVTDNRVTQAFGKPWLDDAASRIMAIQPALPASTADAREAQIRAEVIEECARVCDKAAAESRDDERKADRADDDELSALACEAKRTATYLAETIRALAAKSGGK